MASSEQPDLVLMDLTLPDIRGEEATWRIKADPATKHIPIIALTANAMASDKVLVAMTSTPNRWICRACSEKLKR